MITFFNNQKHIFLQICLKFSKIFLIKKKENIYDNNIRFVVCDLVYTFSIPNSYLSTRRGAWAGLYASKKSKWLRFVWKFSKKKHVRKSDEICEVTLKYYWKTLDIPIWPLHAKILYWHAMLELDCISTVSQITNLCILFATWHCIIWNSTRSDAHSSISR